MANPTKPRRAISLGGVPGTPTREHGKSRETLEIHLRYEGPDVNDGSMSIEDIVPVLQGFSSAYGKLATASDPTASHRVRITAVRPGSAIVVLEAVRDALARNVDSITAGSIVVGGAYWVVKQIVGVISLKKHVKKRPFSERIAVNNTIIVSNSENVTIEVPLEIYELFKGGSLDGDLDKLTSPLVPGRIDAAELEAVASDGIVLRERVQADERPYFTTTDAAVTASQPAWLVAKLNSLTKSTNSGFLYLTDGSRVFYRFMGSNPQELHRLFGTYDGLVRIYAAANLDESLKVVSVDVLAIERVQGDLFVGFEPSSEDESSE